jgi:hypothetical protein
MPQISHQKNEISPAKVDRLHSRDEAGPNIASQISPLPPQNEAGNKELKQADNITKASPSQSGAPATEYLPLTSPLTQSEYMSPPTCSHGIHNPIGSQCSQCLADLETELQNALQELLRRRGWSDEQIKALDERSNTNIPISFLLPKGEGSYIAQEHEFQFSLLQELNRRMWNAEELMDSISTNKEGGKGKGKQVNYE